MPQFVFNNSSIFWSHTSPILKQLTVLINYSYAVPHGVLLFQSYYDSGLLFVSSWSNMWACIKIRSLFLSSLSFVWDSSISMMFSSLISKSSCIPKGHHCTTCLSDTVFPQTFRTALKLRTQLLADTTHVCYLDLVPKIIRVVYGLKW